MDHGEDDDSEGNMYIEIRDLKKSYGEGSGFSQVLRGISCDVEKGNICAILGPSGSGKSTLVRVIMSLLPPDSGRVVLYDGTTEVPSGVATRCNFMYVPQGNSLMSGTIRDNLLLADPEATDSMMNHVLDTAVASFVHSLPDGIDTVCGEGGTGLSEGQAQRIAIARGLLRPGSILLLDEFSSSLDPETEDRLMKNLIAGKDEKTMIFITHRQKISEFCKNILPLER